MKIDKSRKGSMRRSEVHAGAHDRIEHPGRHHQDRSRIRHDMHRSGPSAQLNRLHAQSLAMQRIPAVVNDSFLPDEYVGEARNKDLLFGVIGSQKLLDADRGSRFSAG